MARYKVGERLRSSVSPVQVVVIRADGDDLEITCGGVAFAQDGTEPGSAPNTADGPAIEVGKRYENSAATVELLCVAPGNGELAVNGEPLQPKVPKPLPASD